MPVSRCQCLWRTYGGANSLLAGGWEVRKERTKACILLFPSRTHMRPTAPIKTHLLKLPPVLSSASLGPTLYYVNFSGTFLTKIEQYTSGQERLISSLKRKRHSVYLQETPKRLNISAFLKRPSPKPPLSFKHK